jgi:hypothetical protein
MTSLPDVFGKIVRAIIFISAALTFVLLIKIMCRKMPVEISFCDSEATCIARTLSGFAEGNALDRTLRQTDVACDKYAIAFVALGRSRTSIEHGLHQALSLGMS